MFQLLADRKQKRDAWKVMDHETRVHCFHVNFLASLERAASDYTVSREQLEDSVVSTASHFNISEQEVLRIFATVEGHNFSQTFPRRMTIKEKLLSFL